MALRIARTGQFLLLGLQEGTRTVTIELEGGHTLTLTEEPDTTHPDIAHVWSYKTEPPLAAYPRVSFSDLPDNVQARYMQTVWEFAAARAERARNRQLGHIALGAVYGLSLPDDHLTYTTTVDPVDESIEQLLAHEDVMLDVVETSQYNGVDSPDKLVNALQVGTKLKARLHAFIDMPNNPELTCIVGRITGFQVD